MSRVKEIAYYVGQRVVITTAPAPFRKTVLGVTSIEDPTSIELAIRKPDDTIEILEWDGDPDPEIAHPNVGVFEHEIVTDQHGRWWFRIQGFGNVEASAEGSFYVARSDTLEP